MISRVWSLGQMTSQTEILRNNENHYDFNTNGQDLVKNKDFSETEINDFCILNKGRPITNGGDPTDVLLSFNLHSRTLIK